jgi:hypothetical protein
MNHQEIRMKKRFIERMSIQYPTRLRELTTTEIGALPSGKSKLLRVWRSRLYMVGLWLEPSGFQRLTIQRAAIDNAGQWVDGITWDQMQQLKTEAGFGNMWAVECYPPEDQVVNVANLRHMFLLPDGAPSFGWMKDSTT